MLDVLDLSACVQGARSAAVALATLPSASKDAVLLHLADRLESESEGILTANGADMADAESSGMGPHLLDRLSLTPDRIAGMARDVRHIATLPDPVGEWFDTSILPNGLELRRQRVPLGVIGVIYEARPNVTIDVSALCLKSGNAVVLRGGKEARRSNTVLADLMRSALQAEDVPVDAVQLIRDGDRALVGEMIRMRGQIDLVVPRGGAGLIEYVRENAQVPVLAGGIGVCHTYVHGDADLVKALEIVHNAKTRRPTVCNALDTVLVHAAIAPEFLTALADRWAGMVEMRCDSASAKILQAHAAGSWIPARDEDFGQEFLALRAAIKVVSGLDDALAHVQQYGSGHSEAIVTEGYEASRAWVAGVDAAAVFVNASTQFTDGGQFGLGAELGISTQKFHARGPVGLRELTSYKWVVLGDGQTRPR